MGDIDVAKVRYNISVIRSLVPQLGIIAIYWNLVFTWNGAQISTHLLQLWIDELLSRVLYLICEECQLAKSTFALYKSLQIW